MNSAFDVEDEPLSLAGTEGVAPPRDKVAVPAVVREPPAPPAPRAPARRSAAQRAGRLVGLAMRVVPRRHRFGVAVRLAGVLAVLLRRTRAFGKLSHLRLNSARDISLHLLLSAMTAAGTPFDLRLRLEGEDVLERALASGRGTLVVAPHSLLSLLILRCLHDRGHAPTIIARDARIPLSGTNLQAPTVPPTSNVLVVVRRRLREGGIVCGMVDRMGTDGKQTRAFESRVGQLRVSDAIFRTAARCGAQVLFTIAHAESRGVHLAVAAANPESTGLPELIADDFIRFVQAHAPPA